MPPNYNPLVQEPLRRLKWKSIQQVQLQQSKLLPKKYILAMFPYPSGKLHLGHVRVYAISDCLARYQKMNGFRVLHPMGWDAFGLPAENAARDNAATSAESWTKQNISQMKHQLDQLGFGFDWSNSETGLATCDPDYYRWTQWLFIQMFKKGLAYRASATVNWDPIDKTVLANEQVDDLGRSWRSGAIVEKRLLEQWFLKITHFTDALLKGLNEEPLKSGWGDHVRSMQQNWIGKSEGVLMEFHLEGGDKNKSMMVFTSKPHRALDAINSKIEVNENHEIWKMSSSPVLISATNGARFPVVKGESEVLEILFSENDATSIPKKTYEEAIDFITKSEKGSKHVKYRLKDWLVSRQRRWGAPIPIIHCQSCGPVPVPDKDLPVLLPPVDLKEKEEQWLQVSCPNCGNPNCKRDTDSLDTFVDSSWYFYRYCDPHNDLKPFDSDKVKEWMNVDVYVGGVEHAILHLLYARFFAHFLHSIGLVEHSEPFQRLLSQGMVLGKAYKDAKTGVFIKEPTSTDNVVVVWEKMSKSKHNGVDPQEIVQKHGADITRMAILFGAPPEKDFQWIGDSALSGQSRFLNKIWGMIQAEEGLGNQKLSPKARAGVEHGIKSVTEFLNKDQFNVAIAELMKMNNILLEEKPNSEAIQVLLRLLAPFAPHFASLAWEIVMKDDNNDLFKQTWPKVEELSWFGAGDNIETISIYVKGKHVKNFDVNSSMTDEQVLKVAFTTEHSKELEKLKNVVKKSKYGGRALHFF